MRPVRHPEERLRLQALTEYGTLDAPDAPRLDSLVRLAARICEVPIAFINVIEGDRQCYVAEVGLGRSEAPRDPSVCNYAILENEIFEIPDAAKDTRFSDEPALTGEGGLRFYAGAPLRTPEGLPLGTLCVMDHGPRKLTDLQREALQGLADAIMALLDQYREVNRLQRGYSVQRTIDPAEQAEAEFLRVVTDRLPVRVGYVDREYRYVFLNGAYERMFGFAPREAWGRHVEEIVGTSAWLTAKPFIDRALAGDSNVQEFTADYPFGSVRVEAGFSSDFGPNGDVRGAVIYGVDVTARYEAQRSLFDERKALHRTLETAEVATWQVDVSRKWVHSSPRMQFLFGLPDDGLGGGLIEEYIAAIHPEDRERVSVELGHSIATGETYEVDYRLIGRDGKERWVLARGITELGPDGKAHTLTGVLIDITGRKLAEHERIRLADELLRTEARFRAAQESSPDGFMALESVRDGEGRIVDFAWTHANDAAARIVGRPRGWFAGRRLLAEMPGNEDEGLFAAYVRVVEAGDPWTREFTYSHEGLEVYLRATAVKVDDGFAVTFADLSERRRSEMALRASEERYRTIFDSIDEGFCIIEMIFDVSGKPEDFRYLEVNPAFERLTGLSAETTRAGMTIRQMLPDYEQFWIDLYGRVVLTGEPANEISEVKGLNRWFEVSAARIGGEGSGRVAVVFNDISARKQSEIEQARLLAELSAEREKLQTVFEQAPAFLALLQGRELRFEYANAAYIGLIGGRDVIGKPIGEALPEIEAQGFLELLARVMDTGEPFVGNEVPVTLEQGPGEAAVCRYLDFVYQPVRQADGTVEGVLVQGVDVTERYEMERQIRTMNERLEARVAERTQELQEAIKESEGFNYSVAHDLRSPLRAIIATASILREDFGERLDDTQRELLDRQTYNAGRLGRLIDELLRLSRLARVEVNREPIDMTEKVRSVAVELDATRRVEVQEGMMAHGDRSLVWTVLQNLIGNAFKFSSTDSTVHIGCADGAFFVRDEGVGFDMQYAPKLFLPFERLVREDEFEGTGIGLANVERIVRRHDGRVWR